MDGASSPMRMASLRLGGGMLLAGAVAWLLLSGLHGELPGSGHTTVQEAGRALWPPVHILTIVSIAVVAAGLVLISSTFSPGWAFVLGRAGTALMVPAAAVLGVGYAIGGFVLSHLAGAFAAAPDDAARTTTIMQADLVLTVMGGTSYSFQTMFGLAVAFMAASTLASREYPKWLCWLGLLGGAFWAIAGILIFSRVPGAGTWLILVPVLPVAAWMLAVGWLAWRRGTELAAMSHQSAPTRGDQQARIQGVEMNVGSRSIGKDR